MKNEDHIQLLWSQIVQIREEIHEGGGEKRVKKLHSQGKLTARERIEYLKDQDAPLYEWGIFAGHDMYEEHGGCPAGGVITAVTKVGGKWAMVVANDATVKAGAWFPITGKKNLRAQEIAMENHLPIIYLVDSAGVFLPLQDEIFPDKDHFGRIFRNNAKMSSMGIPQIAAVMGSCVAGGAYLPIMSDECIIVEGTGSIYLAGPYLVKAAIGEDVDNETLGGADTHSSISGVTDYKAKNDQEALDIIKDMMRKTPERDTIGFQRTEPKPALLSGEKIYETIPSSSRKPYDVREILSAIVDEGSLSEYKKDYGKTILCGTAMIDGWSVGIVANQRSIVKNGKNQMQFGGVIYSDSADKAARFIMNCNQKKIPLVFLQDVTGFMVGSASEHGGIIKDGAKLVNAMSNSTVPKFTIVIGNSYGAGNYAMCGKAYDPRWMLAWPNAKLAVMGGEQAAKVLAQIEKATLKKQGKVLEKEDEDILLKRIQDKYENQTKCTYAAARMWYDEIIDPKYTREWLSMGIEISNYGKHEPFNVGVIQT